jgi:citronellol/citronellal dehydrogenase
MSGGSRGIGLEIAKRVAADGANVVICAKTADPHPKLPGTIYTAAEEVEAAGGKALPLQVDVRDDASVQAAVDKTVKEFGGIDIVVNNASAINNSGVQDLSPKMFDLMNSINMRGTYMLSRAAMPHLLKGTNPHILNLSPPLNLDPKWFVAGGTAYTIAKYGMTMCAVGMAAEFEGKVAANTLWPATAVATAAIEMLAGKAGMMASRKPDIMADAAYAILTRDHRSCTGNTFIDEDVLREEGVTNFDHYAVQPGVPLMPDFYLGSADSALRLKKAGEMAKGMASLFGIGKRKKD